MDEEEVCVLALRQCAARRAEGLESQSPTECDANNNPKSAFRQRVIFSLNGFTKSLEVMQKVMVVSSSASLAT
jgi:hypothetical protein